MMTKRLTEQSKFEKDKSVFDFRASEETSTLGSLINELNAQYIKKGGEPIAARDLRRTLEFLEQAIDVKVNDSAQRVPFSTLKTIKLLYVTGANSGKHLLNLVAPPSEGEATMEFSTGTTFPRDKDAAALITSLTKNLSIEVDPVKLKLFYNMLGDKDRHTSAEKLLLHSERTNDEVRHILKSVICGDDYTLAGAYSKLSKLLNSIGVRRTADLKTPAHEALFMYLETLAFQHFARHYPSHLKETRIKKEIGQIEEPMESFCRLVREETNAYLSPSTRMFSVKNFHHIVFGWPKEIAELVKAASGFDTSPFLMKKNTVRSRALLAAYAYRSFDCYDPDAETLSLHDIVASLCSFRYQQEAGDDYKPYWHGQRQQGGDPQRLFDKGFRPNDPYQHQGVIQIYLNRFYEFQASFLGTTQSYHAWMQFQTSRLQAYLRLVEVNDIVGFVTGVIGMNFLCMDMAKEIVIEHLNHSQNFFTTHPLIHMEMEHTVR